MCKLMLACALREISLSGLRCSADTHVRQILCKVPGGGAQRSKRAVLGAFVSSAWPTVSLYFCVRRMYVLSPRNADRELGISNRVLVTFTS